MDYIVYVDDRADELSRIQSESKTMLAVELSRLKDLPERLSPGDWLYLTGDGPQGQVECRCRVQGMEHEDDSEQRQRWIRQHQDRLQLTDRQWKRCLKARKLMLVAIHQVEEVEPFRFNRMLFGHGEDWVPVGDIERAKTLTMRK